MYDDYNQIAVWLILIAVLILSTAFLWRSRDYEYSSETFLRKNPYVWRDISGITVIREI